MQPKETRPEQAADASFLMKERLRADLRSAMRARSPHEVRALRALLTAIDNAQAVPVGHAHERYKVRPFGDASVEVPRLPLGKDDIQRILRKELEVRSSAAAELERCGKSDAAAEARAEAAVIGRYAIQPA
jgi:hypothetical protein